jgi:hypothetical protein
MCLHASVFLCAHARVTFPAIDSPIEKGIELLPVLARMASWGRKYLPVTEELAIRTKSKSSTITSG